MCGSSFKSSGSNGTTFIDGTMNTATEWFYYIFRFSIGSILGALAAWYWYSGGAIGVIPILVTIVGWRVGEILYAYLAFNTPSS
jgi:hypothetical protein